MKKSAPRARASRSSSAKAPAVSAPIAALDPAALSRRMASSPSIPGIRRSMSTRSGRQSAWIERAAGPSAAVRVSKRGLREQLREDVPVDVHVVDDEHLASRRAGRDMGDRLRGRGRRLRADALRHERERERAPDARRALHGEVAAHEPRVGEADGEAEARAAGPLAGVELLERLEHPRRCPAPRCRSPCPRRRSRPRIAPSATALEDAVKRIEPCSVNLTALLARLMRICFTLPPSPRSERGSSGARSIVELDALGRGLAGEHLLDLVERRAEIERILDELGLAGLDLGHLEHVVDERREVLAARADDLDLLPLRRAERGVALEDLRVQQHHVQRVADLVGHVGEKLALGLVGALGFILGVAQLARARRDELLEPLAVGAELGHVLHLSDRSGAGCPWSSGTTDTASSAHTGSPSFRRRRFSTV